MLNILAHCSCLNSCALASFPGSPHLSYCKRQKLCGGLGTRLVDNITLPISESASIQLLTYFGSVRCTVVSVSYNVRRPLICIVKQNLPVVMLQCTQLLHGSESAPPPSHTHTHTHTHKKPTVRPHHTTVAHSQSAPPAPSLSVSAATDLTDQLCKSIMMV